MKGAKSIRVFTLLVISVSMFFAIIHIVLLVVMDTKINIFLLYYPLLWVGGLGSSVTRVLREQEKRIEHLEQQLEENHRRLGESPDEAV